MNNQATLTPDVVFLLGLISFPLSTKEKLINVCSTLPSLKDAAYNSYYLFCS